MFASEGYSTMAAVVIFAAAVCTGTYFIDHWSKYVFYGMMVLLTAIVFYFFRDPDRKVPAGDDLLLAPADGKVIEVKKVDEPYYLKGRATQISIFLSLLDVHVNRIPATGVIEYLKYHPGEYLVAWHEKSSELNERADFGIKHDYNTRIFFRQITGFVARRIVYHVHKGDRVEAGDRFGMMKFGSRMDILVPDNVEVNVSEGDRTVGGETIIGRIGKGS